MALVQLEALKVEMREGADVQAVRQPLLDQIRELEGKLTAASPLDSMLKAARKAAGKADGQVQVISFGGTGSQKNPDLNSKMVVNCSNLLFLIKVLEVSVV